MGAARCPNCGSPMGAGVLAGLCPKCLALGTLQGPTTDDAVAVGVLDNPRAREAAGPDAPGAPQERRERSLPTEPPDDTPPDDKHYTPPPVADGPIPLWTDRPATPRIEGYDVLRPLKQGGQGIVYLAVQRSTKRKVALKLLLDGMFASKSARRRFEREIELVASLKHPNIIAVFDSGTTDDGHIYYVMDYVRGVTITEHVREKGLGLEQVLALFATVCDAVSHAHQRGVIHRDLKPSNILVDVDGNARVLDFGLAKTLTEPTESIVSVTGNVVGTYPYMSPEQTRANPDEIDTRSDVYSLGVVLYETLTGRHPYPVVGTVSEVIRHICETDPTPPTKAWTAEAGVVARAGTWTGTSTGTGTFTAATAGTRTGTRSGTGRRGRAGRCPIDAELATILLKALAKERERRYESAGQLARDVRHYLAGEQIVARRPSAWYQLRVFSRRHKALVAATLSIMLMLVASLAVVGWQLKVAREAWARADEAVDAMDVFVSYGAEDRADAGDLFRAREMLVSALDQSREHGLSGSAVLAGLLELSGRDGGALPLLGTYDGTGGVSAFVHKGVVKPKCVAVLRERRLALTGGGNGQLVLWDLRTGRCVQVLDTQQNDVNYVAVAPDETWAVTAGGNGTVLRWDLNLDPLRDPQEVMRLVERDTGRDDAVWMVAVSDDGSRVIAGTHTGQIAVADPAGRDQRTVGQLDESVPALAFVPGSTRFALSGDGSGNLRLWELDGDGHEVWNAPLKHSNENHRAPQVNSLVFSPDGSAVASISFDGTLSVWDVRGSGQDTRLEPRHPPIHARPTIDRPWRVAFSDDGSTIAASYDSGRVRLWDAKTGAMLQAFRAQEENVEGVAFLDRQTLVSTGGARDPHGRRVHSSLTVWDTSSVRARPVVDGGGAVTALAVDDGGTVRVTTGSGTVERFVGQDGRLHESRTKAGPAAAPWEPGPPRPGAKSPNWGRALRTTRPPDLGDAADVGAGASRAGPVQGPGLPGGKAWLYTGGRDLQLWGTPKPRPGETAGGPVPMRAFRGHRGRVTAAAVSSGGRYVVSGDETGAVLVWDLLRPLRGRDLEQKLQATHERLASDPADAGAHAALREWLSFRGHSTDSAAPAAATGD